MKNPNWLSDDEQKFWRLLLAASRKVNHHIETVLQDDHNLTSAEFAVLVNLSESPEKEIRLRDLCNILNWDRSRASHQVSRMQKRGLLTKRRCIGDGRGVIIELTDEGDRRIRNAAPSHVESVRDVIFNNLDPELLEPVSKFLRHILDQPVGLARN
jgi:transcriptional regulator, MarR family